MVTSESAFMNVNFNGIADQSVRGAKEEIRVILDSLLPPSSSVLHDGDFLTQHGMDSLIATHLSCVLSETFALTLSPTIAFEFPTLDALAAQIVELARARQLA